MKTLQLINTSVNKNPQRRVIICSNPGEGWDWVVQYAAFGWIDEYRGRTRTRWGAKREGNRVLGLALRKWETV